MRKWRRRIVLWLAVVIGAWVVLCIALPYGIMLRWRHQIIAAMLSAESVRLEEFTEQEKGVITRQTNGVRVRSLDEYATMAAG
jgi:hypothetical protein